MADKKISDLTGYTPPVDTDILPIVDTTNTTTKKITWANIKAALKAYFDTLYPSGSGTSSGTNTGDQTDATVTFTDITTNDVTSTKHGYASKSPGDNTKFLRGGATPDWAVPPVTTDATITTTDITTNDVSTSKHGFTPKAPNDTAKYLRGDGAWATLPATLAFKCGVTSRDLTAASGSQTIAHGLGTTPKYIKITAIRDSSTINDTSIWSVGTYNGTTTSAVVTGLNVSGGGNATEAGTDSTNIIFIAQNGTTTNQHATVTFDGTNITLTWTKVGSPTRTAYIMWEAIG